MSIAKNTKNTESAQVMPQLITVILDSITVRFANGTKLRNKVQKYFMAEK